MGNGEATVMALCTAAIFFIFGYSLGHRGISDLRSIAGNACMETYNGRSRDAQGNLPFDKEALDLAHNCLRKLHAFKPV